jgi:hypothetical protein
MLLMVELMFMVPVVGHAAIARPGRAAINPAAPAADILRKLRRCVCMSSSFVEKGNSETPDTRCALHAARRWPACRSAEPSVPCLSREASIVAHVAEPIACNAEFAHGVCFLAVRCLQDVSRRFHEDRPDGTHWNP